MTPFFLLALGACDNADMDTDASDASTGGVDEMDSGAAPIEVGAPVNIRGASDSACHVPGDLPDTFVFASCVGDQLASVDDTDAFCLAGPEPFGALSLIVTNIGEELTFCPLEPSTSLSGGAEWFTSAADYPYVLPVAYRSDGGDVAVDALAISVSSGGYDYRCKPGDDFAFQEIDFTQSLPLGEEICGALSVVEAVPGQAPIIRVDNGASPTYLQMIALN